MNYSGRLANLIITLPSMDINAFTATGLFIKLLALDLLQKHFPHLAFASTSQNSFKGENGRLSPTSG